jgi:hypothetical protein
MRWRQLAGSVLVAGLLLSGCGGGSDGSGKSNDAISTGDSPGPVGPPEPGAATTTSSVAAAPGRRIEAPWSAPTRNVTALIRKAGLPALPQEMLEYHIHSHLDVFVDGESTPVPPDLGIDRVDSVLSPLHTHDESGLIHVENDKETEFRLGQLFVEWDVRLDADCIGAYCRATTPVKYYVDGEEYTGDPAKIAFDRHREIAIVIGKPPANIPRDYSFPPNV